MIPLLASLALAQDLSLTPTSEIDLGPSTGGGLTYEGGLSGTAANYVAGKPVAVAHNGGNVSVRCMDTDKLSARLQYTVHGDAEGPMESYGKGIGISVYGDSKSGSIKTRIPSRPSGVTGADIPLTVNVPKQVTAVTVTQSGSGWVQVLDCPGTLKVSAGAGGAYVSGAMTGVTASASGGDVKVVTDPETVLKSTAAISAPAGNASLVLPSAQGGKLTAQGAEVSVQQTVMGTNTGTVVSGDLGVAGPAITVSAKQRAEVTQH